MKLFAHVIFSSKFQKEKTAPPSGSRLLSTDENLTSLDPLWLLNAALQVAQNVLSMIKKFVLYRVKIIG